MQKYYSILNVTKESTLKEIKESFLRLSKIYHPDNKVTGSHNKFVELKEAYDAVKDGPPATDSGNSYQSRSSYSNYDEHADLSHRAHRYYREKRQEYERPYGFGGPFRHSRDPWEELMRHRAYERYKSDKFNRYGSKVGRPMAQITFFISAIAWIIIYGSFMMAIDQGKHHYSENFRESYLKHLEYEDRISRRQQTQTSAWDKLEDLTLEPNLDQKNHQTIERSSDNVKSERH